MSMSIFSVLLLLAGCSATLRVFMGKKSKKKSNIISKKNFQYNFQKKNFKKKFQNKFQKKISKTFSKKKFKKIMPKLLPDCEKLGGLDTLVKEEIENAQTVHKGLAKLLYTI
jgi:hypothetical protein